jgi:hypothetical protein
MFVMGGTEPSREIAWSASLLENFRRGLRRILRGESGYGSPPKDLSTLEDIVTKLALEFKNEIRNWFFYLHSDTIIQYHTILTHRGIERVGAYLAGADTMSRVYKPNFV